MIDYGESLLSNLHKNIYPNSVKALAASPVKKSHLLLLQHCLSPAEAKWHCCGKLLPAKTFAPYLLLINYLRLRWRHAS